MRALAILVLALAGCSGGGGETQAASESSTSTAPAFPTLEPFLVSRMSGLAFPEAQLDASELLEQMRQWDEQEARSAAVLEEEFAALEERGEPDREAGESALLPELPVAQSALYVTVPIFLTFLEPLWMRGDWSADEVELATRLVAKLAELDGFPILRFELGDDALNQASLEAFVDWFEAAARDPRKLAAMIFTLDDGPFVGMPVEGDVTPELVGRRALGDDLEFRLGRLVGDREPYVFQVARDGNVLWTRRVSDFPHETVREVELLDQAPTDLGRWGWKVHVSASWSGGVEYGHVYVSREGELLFYFLSW